MAIKNPTPRQIALYAVYAICAVNFLLFLIIHLIKPDFISLGAIFVLTFTIFVSAYFAFTEALKRFIYRKIKVIYKTIHRLKAPKEKKNALIDMDSRIIEEVEQEVINWAKDRSNEIDSLKKMEAYRRDFVGNISHELKTPIFNVQGYIYTLLDGGLEDQNINRKYLQKAANNLDRLISIVDDLETISQLEEGKMSIEYQRFDIRDLVSEVFSDIELKAHHNNVSLRFKDTDSSPFFVEADRERIRQVLTNLISNSIKYCRPEEGITQVGFYDMDKYVLIEVADNGIGINEKHIPRLFERFYRVDKGRSRNRGGTGLGLAIVKHIIEAHKQTINARSAIGVGSTFGFTLKKAI